MEGLFNLPVEEGLGGGEEPFSLLPKHPGTAYLGLDVSKQSTGVAVITPNGYRTWSIALTSTEPKEHLEEVLRRELRGKLLGVLGTNRQFTGIAVEDVYTGANPSTVRTLYALNSVIDGMILDGVVTTEIFLRLTSGSWRKILRQAVPNPSRSVNGKVFATETLATYGITTSGRGAQDEVDALGIAMSLYLKPYGGGKGSTTPTRVPLPRVKDISAVYENNLEDIQHLLTEDSITYHGGKSLKAVREALSGYEVGQVLYTPHRVNLGNLTAQLGLQPKAYGGYLAFWRKR